MDMVGSPGPPPPGPVGDAEDSEEDFLHVPMPRAPSSQAPKVHARPSAGRSRPAMPIADDDASALTDQLEEVLGIAQDGRSRREYARMMHMLEEAEASSKDASSEVGPDEAVPEDEAEKFFGDFSSEEDEEEEEVSLIDPVKAYDALSEVHDSKAVLALLGMEEDVSCKLHVDGRAIGQNHHIGCASIRATCFMHVQCKCHLGYIDRVVQGLDRESTEAVLYKWMASAAAVDRDTHVALGERVQREHRAALKAYRESH